MQTSAQSPDPSGDHERAAMPLPSYDDVTLGQLYKDPYPTWRHLRAHMPVAYVKPAGITVITRFDDIIAIERDEATFAALDPRSLQIRSMGHSMMRRDGADHQKERAILEPSFRPATVRDHWTPIFQRIADSLLETLAPKGSADLFSEFASPMSAQCLRAILGLYQVDWRDLCRWSQVLIDATGNYGNDLELWAKCEAVNDEINAAIDYALAKLAQAPDLSVLSALGRAVSDGAISLEQLRANVKVIIGGGLNEPRDSICTAIYGLLSYPDQLKTVLASDEHWKSVFEETVRWVAPICMYPRRVVKDTVLRGVLLPANTPIGLLVASACRDEDHFENGEDFNILRPRRAHLAFGSGPHFCLGTWIARKMVGEIAVPQLLKRFKDIGFDPARPAQMGGWVFRGPITLPVIWTA